MPEKSARLKEVVESFCRHTKNFNVRHIYLPFTPGKSKQIIMHEKVNLDLSADFQNYPNLRALSPADNGVQVYQRLRTSSVERETRRVSRLSQELSKSQTVTKPVPRPKVQLENLKHKLNRMLRQNDAELGDLRYLYKSYNRTPERSINLIQSETSVNAPKHHMGLNSRTKLPVLSINEILEKHRGSLMPRKRNTEAVNFFFRKANK